MLFIFFLGVSYISVTPAWEGYDEIAHYSYLQQLADTGKLLEKGRSYISKDIIEYNRTLPTPYMTIPPLNFSSGGVTYVDWFNSSERTYYIYEKPLERRVFKPSNTYNWQEQHPPLYYLILTPIIKFTANLSWFNQVFILRLASWVMVMFALCMVLFTNQIAAKKIDTRYEEAIIFISLAWPFFFPEFFLEFARLGNDSLAFFLASMVWYLAVVQSYNSQSWWWYFVMGVVLGVGGLTKVTFLPITFSVVLWLLYKSWGKDYCSWRQHIKILVTLIVFLAIAGNWYWSNVLEEKSITGLVELSQDRLGSIDVMKSALGQPVEVFRGLAAIAMTFVWGGSTSSAYPQPAFVLPLLLPFIVLFFCACIAVHKNRYDNELPFLAVLMCSLMLSGLIYYLFTRIALTGHGIGVPGWYLHVIAGPIIFFLGIGYGWLNRYIVFTYWFVRLSLGYACVFLACIIVMQLALFTGVVFKNSNNNKYNVSNLDSLSDLSVIIERLPYLTAPKLGVGSLIVALSMFFLYLRATRKTSIMLRKA